MEVLLGMKRKACTGMKIRTVKYFIGEGISGVWSNRLMSLASIGIVMATLVIFGLFIVATVSVNFIGTQIQQQHEIKVFINEEVSDSQLQEISRQIKRIPFVKACVLETKEDALENFKEQLGDRAALLEGLEKDNPLRNAYIIQVEDIQHASYVLERVQRIQGIANVKSAEEVVDILLKIRDVIRMTSLGMMFLLGFIGIFIISNTIKIAVFSRRKEINIMKYVGATDWFIRWPFIIEGMIIGLLGAVFALGIVVYGYQYVVTYIYKTINIFQLKKVEEILDMLAMLFIVVGTVMGAAGSAISIRKYLRV